MAKAKIYTYKYQTAWLALSRLREYYNMDVSEDGKTTSNKDMSASFMYDDSGKDVIGVEIISDKFDTNEMEKVADRVSGRKSDVVIL